jgi:RecB family endonuclease NucS
MRLVIARCTVDYAGRLEAHLPEAVRLVMRKADGSVSVHADDRAYKPLNWMSPPCRIAEEPGRWVVTGRNERLVISFDEVLVDVTHDLGRDPGLVKDGVEAHLQELLAANCDVLGREVRLVRREFPTDLGPIDLLCRDGAGSVAVEVKRRGDIDGVEQLSRYLERLEVAGVRPVRGVLAAQEIKPQARTLAAARGIQCIELDYDLLRGRAPLAPTLF